MNDCTNNISFEAIYFSKTMQLKNHFAKAKSKQYQIIAGIIVLVGITFRMILFFQNRNLIIDEANVVRNIYERDFIALLRPLSYEQYAPPLFLWVEEMFSHIFGYSEQAMRLTALICGVAALFIYWKMLRKILPMPSALLPFGLFCFAPLLVKYATEVKQYIPDAFVAVSLVYLALKIDIFTTAKIRFFAAWIIIGSIAVWASQPSVFILAAVGFYYFAHCLLHKKAKLIPLLLSIGIVWIAQFFIYYWFILRSQINSDYLQNYHHDYFLYALPHSATEWRHNWQRIREILCNTVGYNRVSLYLGSLLILIGGVTLFRKSVALFILLVCPIFITLLAAALHQFSLIERVCIFILPFTMLLAGLGLDVLLKTRISILKYSAAIMGAYILGLHNFGSLLYRKYHFNELTVGFDYILSKNGTGKELYVDCASRDTYIYYTQIHPNKSKYQALKGAYLFNWEQDNFAETAAAIKTPQSFFIFTGGAPELRWRHMEEVKKVLHLTDTFSFVYSYVYTFQQQ